MFKKIISSLAVIAIMATIIPSSVFAAEIKGDFISNIGLLVDAKDLSDTNKFIPQASKKLTTIVTLKTGNIISGTSTKGHIQVKKSGKVVKTLASWNVGDEAFKPGGSGIAGESWDGLNIDNTTDAKAICGDKGAFCPAGAYKVEVRIEEPAPAAGGDSKVHTLEKDFELSPAPVADIAISEFKVSSSKNSSVSVIDPAPQGKDERLKMDIKLSKVAAIVRIDVKDKYGKVVDTINFGGKDTVNYEWLAQDKDKKVLAPGAYTANLIVRESNVSKEITKTENFEIKYTDASRPSLTEFSVSNASFDPDTGDTTIKFRNTNSAEITLQILKENGDLVKSFSKFSGQSFNANILHEEVWNGSGDDGKKAEEAKYVVSVIARSQYGAARTESFVTLDNSAGSVSSSNSHINGISFRSTFEPDDDEEMEIEFDVRQDLDELVVRVYRGNVSYEIENDTDVEEDKNLTITWDGYINDDDEYAAPGTWTVEFKTKKGPTQLIAQKTVKVSYEEPKIDEFKLSKDEIDTELDEINTILFRVEDDALVTLEVLEGGDVDDEIVEDMEVEQDKWYAIEWDGSGFDEDDNVDLRLRVENTVNEDIFNTKTLRVKIREDKVSSSKSNITNDFISPAATDGEENLTIFYAIEEDAEVTVTIHKGERNTGTKVVELIDSKLQSAGEHSITWNGRNSSGNRLSNGFYTYKIVSKDRSSETESGTFVVGKVGEADKVTASSSSSSSSNNSGKVNPNVVIDGGKNTTNNNTNTTNNNNTNNNSASSVCGQYIDVNTNDSRCDSIAWATTNNVFQGYPDRSFRPHQAINRAEALKVIIEAVGVKAYGDNNQNTHGFSDIQLGQWYVKYLNTAKSMGIFSGDDGTKTARPAETVNRAEVLKLIFETLKTVKGLQINTCGASYNDVSAGAWYSKYACAAKTYGLYDSNILQPTGAITRGEVAELLYKLRSFVK